MPADNRTTPTRTAGASSSRKVLQLLLAFSEARPHATVAELAAALGTPVPTTYRYVALLKELHLLEEGISGSYHLTSRIMPLARAAQLANDLARLARPAMMEASQELRETVMLFQQFEDVAVCTDRVECDRPMRFTFEAGHSIPLGRGASGKMMLAEVHAGERQLRIDTLVQRQGHPSRRDIDEAIAQVHADGYATSTSEIDEGVWACSVPVPSSSRRPTVLSMAGPAERIGPEARATAITTLRRHADRIAAAMAHYAL